MGPIRFARFSLAGLIASIVLFALGMACLMFASSAWGGVVWSVTLAILTLAPLGIIYRRGELRAAWTGVVICGWAYLTLSSGPWFIDFVRPRLVSSKLLRSAYPWLIPPDRRPDGPRFAPRPYTLPPAILEGGLTVDGLDGQLVDVWIKAEDDAGPSLLVAGVPAHGPTGPYTISRPTVETDTEQFLKLQQATSTSRPFVLRPHRPGPLDDFWSSSPVTPQQFEDVGHALCGLLCAGIGALAGRFFFATGDPDTSRREEAVT